MQLAAVYCVSRISGYCACCYAGNLAVLIEGNLAVNYGIAILHVDRCALAVNHTCSSCCTIQCHFSIAIADTFDANQILVQFNLNSFNAIFCILAYADILVTAEVNIFIGFNIFCFGQNTISSKFPSAILQLAYVYCIRISFACCYTGNLAVLIEGNLTIDYSIAILHVDRCALAVNHTCSSCCTIQCQFSIPVADGFDINQILVQLSLNLSTVIAYADILIAAEIHIFTGCYINSGSSNTVSGKIPAFICICSYLFDFFQLAYIYSISIINTCSYVSDYFIVSIQAIFGDVSISANANTPIRIHEVIACLNAVNHKIPAQRNMHNSSIFSFFFAYGNIIISTPEVNSITMIDFSSAIDISCNFLLSGKMPS